MTSHCSGPLCQNSQVRPPGCTKRVSGPANNSECLEVERAAKFIRTTATGKKITRVETVEDTIVYTGGITHEQFVGSQLLSFHFRTNRLSRVMKYKAGLLEPRADVVSTPSVCNGTMHSNGLLGKVLYIELEGAGKMPVLHFGMTGMLRVRSSAVFHLRST